MDLRAEFINRVMRGERVTDLCREYGISRKTGDKFKQRFMRLGEQGLQDASRAPRVIPHRTPPELVALIVAERRRHPTFGPKKLKVRLEKRLQRALPSASTVGNILLRNGLIEPTTRRRRFPQQPTQLRKAEAPNDVWCIDYKGQFRLGDKTLCYPLTITDQFSRLLLCCEGMGAISDEGARDACEEVFRERGLPVAIRSDNGVPFASTGLAGLTKLAVYFMRLGIVRERIQPGRPQQNGQHERMHRTLKAETARPARANLLQQQERFDGFVEEFNQERPHEALGMKRPAEVYQSSPRPHPEDLYDPEYPEHDDTIRVGARGLITFRRRQIHLATSLANQLVGIREEGDGRWLVTFLDLDLGHLGPDGRFLPTPATPSAAA